MIWKLLFGASTLERKAFEPFLNPLTFKAAKVCSINCLLSISNTSSVFSHLCSLNWFLTWLIGSSFKCCVTTELYQWSCLQRTFEPNFRERSTHFESFEAWSSFGSFWNKIYSCDDSSLAAATETSRENVKQCAIVRLIQRHLWTDLQNLYELVNQWFMGKPLKRRWNAYSA